jgi:hypothetical protein
MKKRKNKPDKETVVKIVLNGGSTILDSATVPIAFGFNQKIIEKNPTHVLVLDFSEKQTNELERGWSSAAQRRLFNLRQPINFIEFLSSGRHHLIFWFLKFDSDHQMERFEKNLLSRRYSSYAEDIELREPAVFFEDCPGEFIYSARKIVEIPKIFFAQKPKSKIGKQVYAWSNRWFRTKPIDQCDYRRRRILAFTLQPIAWLLGFVFRLLGVLIMSSVILVVSLLVFIFGGTYTGDILKTLGGLWYKFLIIYPSNTWETALSDAGEVFKSRSYYGYRVIYWKRKIHTFFTPFSLFFMLVVQLMLFIGCLTLFQADEISLKLAGYPLIYLFYTLVNFPRFKKDNQKFKARTKKIMSSIFKAVITINLLAVVIASGVHIGEIPIWLLIDIGIGIFCLSLCFVLVKVFGKIVNPLREIIRKRRAKKTERNKINKPVVKEDEYLTYLKVAYNINQVPNSINLKKIPRAYTNFNQIVQKFKVSYWGTKAKVCKPFED